MSHRIITPLLLMLLLLMSGACACLSGNSGNNEPRAIDGVLDLRSRDLAADGPLDCSGEWEFYWKRLVSPAVFAGEGPVPGRTLISPDRSWDTQTIAGTPIPSFGYATYRLRVYRKPVPEVLALKFPSAGSAFECWVNGARLANAGRAGESPATTFGQYMPQVAAFRAETAQLDIVIHVSNFQQPWGGFWTPVVLGTARDLFLARERNIQLEFFLFGIFIIMGLYHLGLLALRPGEKLPLIFTFYSIVLGVRVLCRDEVVFMQLFPHLELGSFLRIEYFTFFAGIPLAATFIWRSFPAEYSSRAFAVIMAFLLPFVPLCLFAPISFYTWPLPVFQFASIGAMFYSFYALVLAIRRRREGAIPLALGWGALMITALHDILNAMQIIRSVNLLNYGVLMVVFSQSFMLSLRFSKAFTAVENLSGELEKKNIALTDLNNTLERKVEDRTIELQSANEEMQAMNEVLAEARDALWGEMQLAKKIQSVLLPGSPALPGYVIAAQISPAADVGGDYYDVIREGGYHWLVIGDVSGHGVTAGLVMMMVQTAIHATIVQNPGIEPSRLLTLINRTVSANISRFEENKYMTIMVFAAEKEGEFLFSGLHLDFFVYRQRTRQVDVVSSRGMWIGVIDDVEGMEYNDRVSLEPGDVMLLYTDGVTEAYEPEDPADPGLEERVGFFGFERLKALMAENGDRSPVEIVAAINGALAPYECRDDVTMLVVKRS